MSKLKEKIIFAYEKGYRVKDNEIFGMRGKIKGWVDKKGYKNFSMRMGIKIHNIQAHRLLGYQIHGDKIFEKNIHVRHLNNDHQCNYDWNIVLGTSKQNQLDRPMEELVYYGLNATSHVKKYDHVAILNYRKEGATYKQIMEKFGISSSGTLSYIINESYDKRMV